MRLLSSLCIAVCLSAISVNAQTLTGVLGSLDGGASAPTYQTPPYPIAPDPCNGATNCVAFEPTPGPFVAPTAVTPAPGATYAGVAPAAQITPSATTCPAEPGFYPDQSCLNSITGYYGMPQEGATGSSGSANVFQANDNAPDSYCEACQPASAGSPAIAAGSSYGPGSSYTTPSASVYGSSSTGSSGVSFAASSTGGSSTSLAGAAGSGSTSPTQAVVTTNGQLTTPNTGSMSVYPFHAGASTVTLGVTAALSIAAAALLV